MQADGELAAVSADGPRDLWAVGGTGQPSRVTIEHYTGDLCVVSTPRLYTLPLPSVSTYAGYEVATADYGHAVALVDGAISRLFVAGRDALMNDH